MNIQTIGQLPKKTRALKKGQKQRLAILTAVSLALVALPMQIDIQNLTVKASTAKAGHSDGGNR